MSQTQPELFDASDEVAVRERRSKAGVKRVSDEEFLRDMLKARAARDWFWRFLERCHIFEVSWVQGSFDATSFREGERSVGNRILSEITRASPDAYLTMINEHKKGASNA